MKIGIPGTRDKRHAGIAKCWIFWVKDHPLQAKKKKKANEKTVRPLSLSHLARCKSDHYKKKSHKLGNFHLAEKKIKTNLQVVSGKSSDKCEQN